MRPTRDDDDESVNLRFFLRALAFFAACLAVSVALFAIGLYH